LNSGGGVSANAGESKQKVTTMAGIRENFTGEDFNPHGSKAEMVE